MWFFLCNLSYLIKVMGWFEPFLECTAPSIAAADFYCCFIDDLLWFSCDHNFIREEDKFRYQNIQHKIKQYPLELLLIKIELLTMKQQSNIGESQCWYYWSFKCENQKRKAKRVEGREKALTSVLLACPPTSTVSTLPLWSNHIIELLGHPESHLWDELLAVIPVPFSLCKSHVKHASFRICSTNHLYLKLVFP